MPRNHKSVQKTVVPVLWKVLLGSWVMVRLRLISCISCKWSETLSTHLWYPSELPFVLPLVARGIITRTHEVRGGLFPTAWPTPSDFRLPHLVMPIKLVNSCWFVIDSPWMDLRLCFQWWVFQSGNIVWRESLANLGDSRVPSSSSWSPHYQIWLNVGAAVGRRKRLCVK